jgi:hypothetical protein
MVVIILCVLASTALPFFGQKVEIQPKKRSITRASDIFIWECKRLLCGCVATDVILVCLIEGRLITEI